MLNRTWLLHLTYRSASQNRLPQSLQVPELDVASVYQHESASSSLCSAKRYFTQSEMML